MFQFKIIINILFFVFLLFLVFFPNQLEANTDSCIYLTKSEKANVPYIVELNNGQFTTKDEAEIQINAFIEPDKSSIGPVLCEYLKETSKIGQLTNIEKLKLIKHTYFSTEIKNLIKLYPYFDINIQAQDKISLETSPFVLLYLSDIAGGPVSKVLCFTTTGVDYQKTHSVSFDRMHIKNKNAKYLIKRELGLLSKGDWRISEYEHGKDNKDIWTILQGDLSMPCEDADLIEASLKFDSNFNKVQFYWDTNGNGLPDDTILFSDYPSIFYYGYPNSKLKIFLDWTYLLKNVELSKAKLSEAIFFFDNKLDSIKNYNPILNITFYKKIIKKKFLNVVNSAVNLSNSINLSIHKFTEEHSSNEEHYFFNVKEIASLIGGIEKIKKMEVFLPSNTTNIKASFFNHINKKYPEVAAYQAAKELDKLIQTSSFTAKNISKKIPTYVEPLFYLNLKPYNDHRKQNFQKVSNEFSSKIPFLKISTEAVPSQNQKVFNTVKGPIFVVLNDNKLGHSSFDGNILFECKKEDGSDFSHIEQISNSSLFFKVTLPLYSIIENVSLIPRHELLSSKEYELWVLNTKWSSPLTLPDYSETLWWSPKYKIPLIPNRITKTLENKDGEYCFNDRIKTMTFSIPKYDYFGIEKLILPDNIQGNVTNGNKNLKATKTVNGLKISAFTTKLTGGDNIELNYTGDEKNYCCKPPSIQTIITKITPQTLFNKSKIILDGKLLEVIPALPATNGSLLSLNTVKVSKGKHEINLKLASGFSSTNIVLQTKKINILQNFPKIKRKKYYSYLMLALLIIIFIFRKRMFFLIKNIPSNKLYKHIKYFCINLTLKTRMLIYLALILLLSSISLFLSISVATTYYYIICIIFSLLIYDLIITIQTKRQYIPSNISFLFNEKWTPFLSFSFISYFFSIFLAMYKLHNYSDLIGDVAFYFFLISLWKFLNTFNENGA